MTDPTDYVPPKIWTWKQGNGGRFANINRPVSGAPHEKDLPVGRHPLQLYSLGTPNRFAMETKRQLDVLDKRLADNAFLAGPDYTIADIAVWPWYGGLMQGLMYGEAAEFLQVGDYKNVKRWTELIAARPAVKRGRMVNRVQGEPSSQLRERHDPADFDTRTQDKVGDAAQ